MKQLFGDIPAISEYISTRDSRKPSELVRPTPKAGGRGREEGRGSGEDEYLIRHKERLRCSKRETLELQTKNQIG